MHTVFATQIFYCICDEHVTSEHVQGIDREEISHSTLAVHLLSIIINYYKSMDSRMTSKFHCYHEIENHHVV